jgi:hypothetical protein
MMALLGGLGIKDIFYGVLVTIALTWGGWTYHKYEAAVTYAANAKAATVQVEANVKKAIDDLNTTHAAAVAAIQVVQDAQLKTAAAQSADLAQRLRNYQTNRGTCPVLGSTAPAPTAGTAGASSVDEAVAGVIVAAAHDNAVITAERAERDSLNGK